MLPIKFADPSRLYSSGDLKTQLRLVVTNGGPSASHGTRPPQLAVHEDNPFLNSYPDGERTAALTKVVEICFQRAILLIWCTRSP